MAKSQFLLTPGKWLRRILCTLAHEPCSARQLAIRTGYGEYFALEGMDRAQIHLKQYLSHMYAIGILVFWEDNQGSTKGDMYGLTSDGRSLFVQLKNMGAYS